MFSFGRKRDEKHSALHNMQIATPCSMPWDKMIGDERTRYCDSCKLSVYNISELTLDEAETLIAENDGVICGRVFRRADGTVITKDCPVGLRKAWQKAISLYGSLGAVAAAVITWFLGLEPSGHATREYAEPGGCATLQLHEPVHRPQSVVGRLVAPPRMPEPQAVVRNTHSKRGQK